MLFPGVEWSNYNEELTRRAERDGVSVALRLGRDVIVDNTNLDGRTRYGWEEFARLARVKLRQIVLTTPEDVCIERDALRQGSEHLGEEIIKKHFKLLGKSSTALRAYDPLPLNRAFLDRESLRAGEFPLRLPNAPIVLCDVDGTLATHVGIDGRELRSPYDETRVLSDLCHEAIAQRIRELYPTHTIIIVSGRHDDCCSDTEVWLEAHNIPFDYLLMRPSGSSEHDYDVKQLILDELLTVVPKSQIAYVLDDRKQVVDMWKRNGLRVVVAARGQIVDNPVWVHTEGCQFALAETKGYRRCDECGALESF
jgi:hypothetical protein